MQLKVGRRKRRERKRGRGSNSREKKNFHLALLSDVDSQGASAPFSLRFRIYLPDLFLFSLSLVSLVSLVFLRFPPRTFEAVISADSRGRDAGVVRTAACHRRRVTDATVYTPRVPSRFGVIFADVKSVAAVRYTPFPARKYSSILYHRSHYFCNFYRSRWSLGNSLGGGCPTIAGT